MKINGTLNSEIASTFGIDVNRSFNVDAPAHPSNILVHKRRSR